MTLTLQFKKTQLLFLLFTHRILNAYGRNDYERIIKGKGKSKTGFPFIGELELESNSEFRKD